MFCIAKTAISVSHNLSSYASSLTGAAKVRYLEKIRAVSGHDPLLRVPRGTTAVSPPTDVCDLVPYLVLETSTLTAQQFKARKGLEAYLCLACTSFLFSVLLFLQLLLLGSSDMHLHLRSDFHDSFFL